MLENIHSIAFRTFIQCRAVSMPIYLLLPLPGMSLLIYVTPLCDISMSLAKSNQNFQAKMTSFRVGILHSRIPLYLQFSYTSTLLSLMNLPFPLLWDFESL